MSFGFKKKYRSPTPRWSWRSSVSAFTEFLADALEEVGVDEGEDDEAETLKIDHNMPVFGYALHGAFVAFKHAVFYPYPLAGLEVFYGVDAAAACVVGCEHPQ